MRIAKWLLVALVTASSAAHGADATKSCFLLEEVGGRELRRKPAEACALPLSPASTFKVPHALAALDSGVIAGPDEAMPWDGSGQWGPSARRTHTLASAMRHSVVWYFQRVAQRLGAEREAAYLQKLGYGNRDASSGLTTFWLGGSLLVTPGQQADFWQRLYRSKLPVSEAADAAVKRMLVQPQDHVVDARGEHAFAAPWKAGVTLSAKTGSIVEASGRAIRWLVGHVSRSGRELIFVSCVVGDASLPADAAIDLAAKSLREEGVL